jgi:membrane dipeptidase
MADKSLLKMTPSEEQRALHLYKESTVIDCLNYSPTLPNLNHPEYLEEYAQAGVTAIHFTIQTPDGDLSNFLNQVSLWHELARNTDCRIAETAHDIRVAKKEQRKCLIFGIQNAKPLGDDLALVRVFHLLGIRIVQPAYDGQNLLGSGGDGGDAGITKLGRKIIEEMNRIGILIDASHCGFKTTMDAIHFSAKPIACTHTNPKALCDHYRNKTNEQLKALAERGGVVGLTAFSPISRTHKDKEPTLIDFLDFIDYVSNLIGSEHVGFGLDLAPVARWDEEGHRIWAQKNPGLAPESIDKISIAGLDKPSRIINIARGLVSRGYTDEEITGILGENILRLFKAVW